MDSNKKYNEGKRRVAQEFIKKGAFELKLCFDGSRKMNFKAFYNFVTFIC